MNHRTLKWLFVLCAMVITPILRASNVITYTATNKLSEYSGLHTNAFNVSIISHLFNNGQGVITFAGDVTSIGEYAFYDCSSLTSITIPNSVTSIGNSAFLLCTSLQSITIPNSVTSIGDLAFSGCSSLTSINVDAANTHYASINGVLFNYAKKTLIQYPAGNNQTEYTIPNSVTNIGNSAFLLCTSLQSITIPNSVTSIGEYAFYDCSSLTSITIPNSVTSIGEYAFYYCSSLTSITIPNSVTSIGDYAFSGVNNVVYSGTATGSPWDAKCLNGYVDGYLVYTDATKTSLASCSSAATGSITIPNSVTSIGDQAFYGCFSLTSITIGNGVTSIGDQAFYGCFSLTSINVDAANKHYASINDVLFNYAKKHLSNILLAITKQNIPFPIV